MKTTFTSSTQIPLKESNGNRILIPEAVGYAGSLMAIGAVSLFMYRNWEEITQPQRTATFSLIAIALFVTGLVASNGADIRRRVSSYLYTLATISSFAAVYVTFPYDPPVLQSFALATVVALLGYTISSTLLGHAALFLAAIGTLVGLGYELVDSKNLQLYFQISLAIALSLTWMAIAAVRIIDQDLGLLVAGFAIIGTGQVAFFQGYENLAYSIGVGFIAIAIWLYTKVSSWTLAVGALTALGAGATEFVVETMENSLAAIVGMLLVGGIVTTIGIRAAGANNR